MNDTIKSISSKIKETALSLARHEDATEEINALLSMAECLEEIGAERNRPLTLEEALATRNDFGECVWVELRDKVGCYAQISGQSKSSDMWEKATGKSIDLVRYSVFGNSFLFGEDTKKYGITWRCWLSKPTVSERIAAKWDEAQEPKQEGA